MVIVSKLMERNYRVFMEILLSIALIGGKYMRIIGLILGLQDELD